MILDSASKKTVTANVYVGLESTVVCTVTIEFYEDFLSHRGAISACNRATTMLADAVARRLNKEEMSQV